LGKKLASFVEQGYFAKSDEPGLTRINAALRIGLLLAIGGKNSKVRWALFDEKSEVLNRLGFALCVSLIAARPNPDRFGTVKAGQRQLVEPGEKSVGALRRDWRVGLGLSGLSGAEEREENE
jgi:hypothetical protein